MQGQTDLVYGDRLFWALAEQLKIPFMQIARSAETGQVESLAQMQTTADLALQLLDAYLASANLGQASLQLQPVVVPLVMQEAAHRLVPHAKNYGCSLELDYKHSATPVMANAEYLQSAFVALGYAFIEAQSAAQKNTVVFGAHKSTGGTVAGVFGKGNGFSQAGFNKARQLYGNARQPFTGAMSSSGAGMFIADAIVQSMASPLKVARHNKMTGLATTLFPSMQLELISL